MIECFLKPPFTSIYITVCAILQTFVYFSRVRGLFPFAYVGIYSSGEMNEQPCVSHPSVTKFLVTPSMT